MVEIYVLFGVLFVETFGSIILVVDSEAKTETETTTEGYFKTEISIYISMYSYLCRY